MFVWWRLLLKELSQSKNISVLKLRGKKKKCIHSQLQKEKKNSRKKNVFNGTPYTFRYVTLE